MKSLSFPCCFLCCVSQLLIGRSVAILFNKWGEGFASDYLSIFLFCDTFISVYGQQVKVNYKCSGVDIKGGG